MEEGSTRVCGLLVALGDVEVLGVDDAPGALLGGTSAACMSSTTRNSPARTPPNSPPNSPTRPARRNCAAGVAFGPAGTPPSSAGAAPVVPGQLFQVRRTGLTRAGGLAGAGLGGRRRCSGARSLGWPSGGVVTVQLWSWTRSWQDGQRVARLPMSVGPWLDQNLMWCAWVASVWARQEMQPPSRAARTSFWASLALRRLVPRARLDHVASKMAGSTLALVASSANRSAGSGVPSSRRGLAICPATVS